MKKYLIGLIVLGNTLFNMGHCAAITNCSNFMLQGKAAYFIPTDSTFRKIYGETGLYSLDFRFPVYKDLIGWTEVGYLTANGKTTSLKYSTRMQMVPLIAGLQYSPHLGRFQPFLGLGIDVTYLHVKNSSPFMIHEQSKWGVGGICTAGTLIHVTNSFFLDIFGDYTFVKVNFHNTNHGKVVPRTADLSGFAVGGGIGYHF